MPPWRRLSASCPTPASRPRVPMWSATPPPLARFTGSSSGSEPTSSSSVPRTAAGSGAQWLVELSERVDLLVVGSRRWGPVRRTLLGSTSARLIRKAGSPVVVVPRGIATGEPGEHDPAASAAGATS
ncbi:MAG TPA: universal stress protein [Solirubrobacteraceae bacterium]|nr:universal stress protein [Solirubrobacteraceae bacterium]